MAITNLDHIAIAVNDLESATKTWQETFGLPLERTGESQALGIRQAFLPIGSAFIELISPLSESGPVADALKNKGEGLYLLSLAVDDLDATLAFLEQAEIPLLLPKKMAVDGNWQAWIEDPDGNRIELAQDLRS